MHPNWSTTSTWKIFSTYLYPGKTFKNSSCRPDDAIGSPGLYREYYGYPKIVDDIGLINLSTMNPLPPPQSLSTELANDVSKLFAINESVGFLDPLPHPSYLGSNNVGARFAPGTASDDLSLGLTPL